jgi:hypothetical protein
LPGALHTALFIALQLLSRELFASDHPNFIILRPQFECARALDAATTLMVIKLINTQQHRESKL